MFLHELPDAKELFLVVSDEKAINRMRLINPTLIN